MNCKAYQQQDEMFCPVCKIRWGVDDPEPPKCPKKDQKAEPKIMSQRVDLFNR